jgi:hypothetical protein
MAWITACLSSKREPEVDEEVDALGIKVVLSGKILPR